MRRSSSHIDQSLELLLDTICNTLGGILFMALLVCLLNERSGREVSSAVAADARLSHLHQVKMQERKHGEVRNRVEQLRAEHEQQLRILGSFQGKDNDGVLPRLVKLQIDQQRELSALADLQREIKQARDQQDTIHRQEHEADAAITATLRQTEESEKATKAIKEKQKMRLRLPMARSTMKQQIALLLSGGKIRMPFAYDDDGHPLGRNMAEIEIGAPTDKLQPGDFVPASGTTIEDTDVSRNTIAQRLASFKNRDYFMAIAVWPDSYKEFRILRDYLVNKGAITESRG